MTATPEATLLHLYTNIADARREILGHRAPTTLELSPTLRESIRTIFHEDLSALQVVQRIVSEVQTEGDAALRRYTELLDGVKLDDLVVPDAALDEALASISNDLRRALEVAADRVRVFHERARRQSWLDFADGGALGQMIVPLERVGIYAPGGRAAYPSTVLMAAVPGRVAGVRDLVLATPPGRDGRPSATVLAAARIAGVDRVYAVGGAQAIAALAYGTETVQRVDKIVGPGNLFVVLAKQVVMGIVGIDGLPGPTETVVVADQHADPAWIAADMLAQAEHDPLAQSLLICVDRGLADRVMVELERQLAETPRAELIRGSFRARGAIVIAGSVGEAIDFANEHAPEHLCLSIADPWRYIGRVRNAGGVFVGEGSVEAIGDYTAGPSHIMPTGGTARFASPLNLDDFIKVISVFSFGQEQLRALGEPAIALAQAEGLAAHAAAIQARLDGAAPAVIQVPLDGADREAIQAPLDGPETAP
jgi:histidinol dehydrogenase